MFILNMIYTLVKVTKFCLGTFLRNMFDAKFTSFKLLLVFVTMWTETSAIIHDVYITRNYADLSAKPFVWIFGWGWGEAGLNSLIWYAEINRQIWISVIQFNLNFNYMTHKLYVTPSPCIDKGQGHWKEQQQAYKVLGSTYPLRRILAAINCNTDFTFLLQTTPGG